MISKFKGTCRICGAVIPAGSDVAYDRNTRTIAHNPPASCVSEREDDLLDFTGPAEPKKEIAWSENQNNLFNFAVTGTGSATVIAVAGSGKTTAAMEMIRRILREFTGVSVRYVVFNAKNSDEAKRKIPSGAEASTFHAACNRELQAFMGKRFKPEGNKLRLIMRKMVDDYVLDRQLASRLGASAVNLARKAKGAGMGVDGLLPDTDESWVALVERFDIDFGDELMDGIDLAKRLLSASICDKTMIDFDDMLYLSALWNIPMRQFDFLVVDEAQDFNAIQRLLCHKMLKPGGRLIAVGDPYQSIYGFRGADFDSIERIKQEFDAIELPLDISYRCPQAVVAEAQKYVPHIRASETAPVGLVQRHEEWSMEDFESGDTILCRANAPLVGLAYRLLAQGIPCKVMGREIGEGLIKLIDKMRAFDLDDLQERLLRYQSVEIASLINRMKEEQAQAVEDKVESILTVISSLAPDRRTIDGVKDYILNVFSDEQEGITLSSVHKAKGLEWPRVWILNSWMIPSKYAKTPDQKQQEMNIMYVAITRAQQELHYIDDIKRSVA